MAIVFRLSPGRVVRTVVPDPQGRNPKNRRCILLEDNDDSHAPLVIVAVTSTIDPKYAEEYVELPFGPNAATRFRKRSAAHCIAVYAVERSALEITRGVVGAKHVDAILDRVKALGDRVRVQRL